MIVLTLSLVVTRAATIALTATGTSREAVREQVLVLEAQQSGETGPPVAGPDEGRRPSVG